MLHMFFYQKVYYELSFEEVFLFNLKLNTDFCNWRDDKQIIVLKNLERLILRINELERQ
jgi:hypothetical protein